MLHIVAFPVQLIDSVPEPKYSTIAFVPPETVNCSATFRMISFGEVHPFNLPVSLTPIRFG